MMSDGSCGKRDKWGDLLPASILLLVTAFGALIVGLTPRAGQTQFAVVAAPWHNLVQTAEMVGVAGGAIVDAGRLPNVIIAHSDSPEFINAVRRAGAWLVLDPVVLRGCLNLGARPDPIPAKG
jgi:hypothetical protein